MKRMHRWWLVALALVACSAHAADQFVQISSEASGTTTAVATLSSVVAGNTIVAFLCNGSAGGTPTVHTVADAQGSYTGRDGSGHFDNSNFVWCQPFTLENATSGTHTITGTSDVGDPIVMRAVEVTAATTSFSGAVGQLQAPPGATTDATTSTSVTVTGTATLIGFSADTASGTAGDAPNASSTFTSRATAGNGAIGAYRYETKSVTTNTAATFTATQGSNNHLTFGVAILNGTAAAPTLSLPTPSGTLGTSTTATLGATTDQSSGNVYAVVDTGSNLVGVTATQVKAGNKAAGTAALKACGPTTVSTSTPSCGVTGLTASTAYVYAVTQNNTNGDSNVVTGSFTTGAGGSTKSALIILELSH